ncbi:tannase/feruloyl esterase family alpha/beta hydrolase [Glacieibacterium megasporae]|uniref:tannase/feruloyl esterase family alpha/beta hydrolase n=1 Tax=Glacieibacterium megasporae TaxID=2835787 RepID=UPI002106F2BB|nr:tannase/feruloyl esterase family alpha/beta hydrolase [Polymorphobacter megasporae]
MPKIKAMLLVAGSVLATSLAGSAQAAEPADRCAMLAQSGRVAWPDPTTRIISAVGHGAEAAPAPRLPPGVPPMPALELPAHCDVIATMHERTGVDGQHYAIRFHLRLPDSWNGKFFMQGGGGTNGELGDAIGRLSGGAAPALVQGYAVMSQDSGHDNATNTVPARGGVSAFGLDPQARADYGGTSLRPTVEAAKALVAAFYQRPPQKSYFVGCSKGGQEGMMLATRYPDLFDGIVAAAPGFALPRAALAEAWDTQALAGVVRAKGEPVTLASLAGTFSAADGQLVRRAVLAACDKADGVVDGIIADYTRCTSERVLPELAKITCAGDKQDSCLTPAQLTALRKIHDGARDPKGKPIYSGFYWDAGWGDDGWRVWKTGAGPVPSINVAMGSPSLGAVFTTPPTALPEDNQAKLDYLLHADMNAEAAKIYATGDGFTRSAWQDIGSRSADLSAFQKRGGKLVVPQGVSDPVFSVEDTIAWYKEVDQRDGGGAAGFVRVFPVPGMGHCQGGPATDGYDAFGAVVAWVEHAKAPESLIATANPRSPWPGRTRPLCAFPKVARYDGTGDVEKAASFTCS